MTNELLELANELADDFPSLPWGELCTMAKALLPAMRMYAVQWDTDVLASQQELGQLV